MKKYETPECEIEKFTIVSVFTASSLDSGDNGYDNGDGFDF